MEYDAFSSTNTQNVVPCGTCGRNFNPDALARHGPICAKSTSKNRKVYDMAKHRADGTDLEEHTKNERFRGGGNRRPEPPARKNNWRQQHEEFIHAIRSAKGVSKALATGAPLPPPPPPSLNPDYVQCQFCTRRFNQSAFERHVTFCKEQHDRLPNKNQPSATAIQRANARTAYKVPKPKGKTVTSPTSTGYGMRTDHYSGTPGRAPGGATPNRGALTRHGRGGGHGMSGNSGNSDFGPSSGRALRTGRTAETYSEARELSAKQRTTAGTARRYPSRSSVANFHGDSSFGNTLPGSYEILAPISSHDFSPGYGGGNYNPQSSRGGYNTHTGPTKGGMAVHNGDLGSPHSGNSDLLTSKQVPARSGSGIVRFCHDCGTKYATAVAKFCSECGVKRVAMT